MDNVQHGTKDRGGNTVHSDVLKAKNHPADIRYRLDRSGQRQHAEQRMLCSCRNTPQRM